MALARYAGKLAKMYPEDPLQALFVDEIMDTVAEVAYSVPNNPDPEVKKKLREDYAAGKLNTLFSFLAEKVTACPGPFLFGAEMTIADVTLYGSIKTLRGGIFDHIPKDYDTKWPELQQFVEAMEADPVFAPYKIA